MRKYLVIAPLLFAALGAPAALLAGQVYNVNLTLGADTVTGTIDTDGTLGTLNAVEINSFSFGVSRSISSPTGGGGTSKESGTFADIDITGDAVTTTAAGLFFNFNSTDPSQLAFLNVNGAFLLCLFTDGACDPSGSGEVLTLDGTTLALTGLSGNQLLATSASVPSPEPGTFGLMLIVVVGLMLMPRKRSAQGLQLDVGTHS